LQYRPFLHFVGRRFLLLFAPVPSRVASDCTGVKLPINMIGITDTDAGFSQVTIILFIRERCLMLTNEPNGGIVVTVIVWIGVV